MPRTPREPSQSDQVFTVRLNTLFDTHRDPEGNPYSVRHVAAHVGVSASYISALRRGNVTRPGADKVEALARFFGVEMAYFMGSEHVELPAIGADNERLRKALENPLVREIAVTTGDFNIVQTPNLLIFRRLLVGRRFFLYRLFCGPFRFRNVSVCRVRLRLGFLLCFRLRLDYRLLGWGLVPRRVTPRRGSPGESLFMMLDPRLQCDHG